MPPFSRSTWLSLTYLILLVALALLALNVLARRPFVENAQPHLDPTFALAVGPGGSVGQSFVARHAGLTAVELGVRRPAEATAGTLVATLLPAPDSNDLIAQARLPIAALPPGGTVEARFAPVAASRDQTLFLRLEAEGLPAGTAIEVAGNQPFAYLHGTAWRDGAPLDSQLRFRLVYTGGGLARDVVAFFIETASVMALAALLFALPGYAALLWAAPALARDARLAWLAAPAVGLALYALIYLWLDVFGVALTRPLLLGGLALAAALAAWRLARRRRERPQLPARMQGDSWADVALAGVAGLLALSRLWPIQALEGPSWGDSVQHAVIAQAMLDHQGLFANWLPYAPYGSLTTHFGFSAATALFSLASGLPVLRSTLLVGQLLNIAAVLALYPLAAWVSGGRRWAGVGAVAVAGLLMPMPAEYVNWGRYAQLAGQVILPVAILLAWHLLVQPTRSLREALLGGAVVAGLALCYYRMPIAWALFFALWGLLYALPAWRKDWRQWRLRLAQATVVGGTAGVALLPWLARLRQSRLSEGVVAGLVTQSPLEAIRADYLLWRDVTVYVPLPLLAACAVALGVATVRPRRWPWLLAGWTALMAGSKATQLVNLPLANFMQSFAILILLYIPVALGLGWAWGQLAGRARSSPLVGALLCTAVLGLSALGAAQRLQVVKDDFVMVTRPDLDAMAWVRQHTPRDARFLVNGFLIYNGTSAVGADAGWWLPLLAGRANTMPPQYAMLNEQPLAAGYTTRMVSLVRDVGTQPLSGPEQAQRLCAEGVTHIFSGQRQGRVGSIVSQLLDPVALEANPALEKIYHRNQVRIFALRPDLCASAPAPQPPHADATP